MSCERKYQTSIADLYAWDILIGKFLRFTLPFLVALIVEIGFQIFNHTDISLSSVVHLYLVGGKGPGSYYYPLMIQLIFIFPALYWLMRRGSIRGLIIIGVANLTYEIMIHAYGMGAACYRLLVFRYLLMLGFGCYLYINKDEKQNKIALLIMIAIGIAYIVVTKYTGYEEKLFTYWTSTSMMTAFWIFPVFYMVYKLLRDARPSKIQIIGKASYHIFLTQMVYYGYVFRLVRGYLPDFTLIHLLVNVVFCISLGMIFYLVENKINKIVLRKVLSWVHKNRLTNQ